MKRSRTEGVSNFHYRRSLYDVAFAISITDEILNLEPLEDKLFVLKRKQERGIFDIIIALKSRVSFFAIYNLFDTVEHNQIDNQSTIQKILLHMKKQEIEIDTLKKTVNKLMPLSAVAEEWQVEKLE